jgi:Uma2 family endonuclease
MTIQLEGLGKVRPGVNISDRIVDWKHNFRVPDIVVFLNDTLAECHDTFWFGGPDFAIEIVSPDDRTRDKPRCNCASC